MKIYILCIYIKRNENIPPLSQKVVVFRQAFFLHIQDNQVDKPSSQMGTPGVAQLTNTSPLRQPLVQLMDICHSPTTAARAAVSAAMKYV